MVAVSFSDRRLILFSAVLLLWLSLAAANHSPLEQGEAHSRHHCQLFSAAAHSLPVSLPQLTLPHQSCPHYTPFRLIVTSRPRPAERARSPPDSDNTPYCLSTTIV